MNAILVCGDRRWGLIPPGITDPEELLQARRKAREEVDILHRALRRVATALAPCTVIHGAAPGADTHGGFFAKAIGLPVEAFPADWKRYGRGAGPKRNAAMLSRLREFDGQKVGLAFHRDITKSKGTADMLRKLERAEIPTELHNDE